MMHTAYMHNTHAYIHTYIHTYIHAYMYIHTYINMYVLHMYIHVHTHVHTTYIYVHDVTCLLSIQKDTYLIMLTDIENSLLQIVCFPLTVFHTPV